MVLSGWVGPSFLFQLFFNMFSDFQKGSEGSGDTPIIPVLWFVCSGSKWLSETPWRPEPPGRFFEEKRTLPSLLDEPTFVGPRTHQFSVGDKVRQAYDKSQALKERRAFMDAWCDALVSHGLKV